MSIPSNIEREAVDLLTELVSIDSQNPPGREKKCSHFIYETLRDWGIEATLIDDPYPDRPQVLAKIGAGGPGTGTLVLNGHIDTVPPGDLNDWEHEPFEAFVSNDRIYGRGTSDMKGGITAGMLAAKAAAESDAVDGEVILTFAIGEETGEPGTKRLVEDLDADFGVVLEPTALEIATVGKGLAWYEAEIRGKSCHASRPDAGENSIDALLSLKDELNDYRDKISDRSHELVGQAYCSPTIVHSGEKENVIPSMTDITLDRRIPPGENIADVDKEIDALFDRIRDSGFKVDVERIQTYEAAEIPVDAKIARVFRQYSADIAEIDTSPKGKIASTDQRNLVNDAGIPAIIWGPGTPSQAHTTDEWIYIDNLVNSIKILYQCIEHLCSDGSCLVKTEK